MMAPAHSDSLSHEIPMGVLPMSVYEAAIVDTDASATVIQCVRKLTSLSIPVIRQRIADGDVIVTWDSDDYALDGDRESVHARILAGIDALRSAGCTLRFQYRPALGDSAESVSDDQMLNQMQTDVDFDSSDHI